MTAKKTSICPSCGKSIKEDFNNCPYCGKTIRIVCHKCGKLLEEEFLNCPYCGVKVKKESAQSSGIRIPVDYREKIASLLTSLSSFIQRIGQVLKPIFSSIVEFIKSCSHKILEWLRSIDWGKIGEYLKGIGGKVQDFIKTATPELKKIFDKIWSFLKKYFILIRDYISNLLEKKLSPEIAKKAAVGIIITLISICFLLTLILTLGPDSPKEGQIAVEPTNETLPAVDPALQKWLVMVYADADDEILEEDMLFDINEMEMAGSSERVQIVAQIDRFNGGYAADGDWTNTRRYLIQQDSDLTIITSPVVEELGEINMGDPESLIDFVSWSIDTYPADRYVLILSDHGGGWTGGWTDPDPSYDFLTLNEIAYAFDQLVPSLPNKNFDIIGFDACLMSQLDVYSTIAPYARYSIASEEVEPAAGWAYNAFLQSLVDNPAMDARDLASIIVDTYLEQDQRFINNEARARLFQGNTSVTLEDALDLVMPSSTLTAVELAYIPEINQALNTFAYDITVIDQTKVAAARNYAPSFQSVFGKDTVPSFIDLVNFTRILEQEAGAGFDNTSGTYLRELVDKAIIKNKAGREKIGAQGISIYFPNSDLYKSEYGGYEVYTFLNNRFMEDSLWDDFLAFHYAGVAFDPDSRNAVLPARSADVAGPGMGEIQVGKITLSTHSVSPGDRISFATEITGTNIGNVYMQYGWLAKDVNTMLVILGMDYIRSDQSREVGGVYYPDWGTSGRVPISYDFEPMLGFIADEFEENITFVEAVVTKYGATEDDIIITVPGIFTFGRSGRQLYAEINFDSTGILLDVIGYTGQIEIVDLGSEFKDVFQINYTGEEGAGSPYPVTPSVGDKFMPFFMGYVIEEDLYLNVKSDPISFTESPFTLVAASVTEFDIDFPYYVAVVVEDLDGNLTDAATLDTFTVKR